MKLLIIIEVLDKSCYVTPVIPEFLSLTHTQTHTNTNTLPHKHTHTLTNTHTHTHTHADRQNKGWLMILHLYIFKHIQ